MVYFVPHIYAIQQTKKTRKNLQINKILHKHHLRIWRYLISNWWNERYVRNHNSTYRSDPLWQWLFLEKYPQIYHRQWPQGQKYHHQRGKWMFVDRNLKMTVLEIVRILFLLLSTGFLLFINLISLLFFILKVINLLLHQLNQFRIPFLWQ